MKKKILQNKPLDYKNIATLKAYVDSYGRVLSRRQSEVSLKYQRSIARAVKHARFMGFLPFIAR